MQSLALIVSSVLIQDAYDIHKVVKTSVPFPSSLLPPNQVLDFEVRMKGFCSYYDHKQRPGFLARCHDLLLAWHAILSDFHILEGYLHNVIHSDFLGWIIWTLNDPRRRKQDDWDYYDNIHALLISYFSPHL